MKNFPQRRNAGFTLIELMVGIVIGLIVIGAVLSLIAAMIRTNNQTIQATRLTQELRGAAAVITSDLQRAGSAENPFNLTGAAALGTVDDATPGCIKYSYSDLAGTKVDRAISLSGGAVFLGTTACGNGGTRLSSNNVRICSMTFNRTGRNITVTLAGKLGSAGVTCVSTTGDSAINRTYTQSVFAPGLGV